MKREMKFSIPTVVLGICCLCSSCTNGDPDNAQENVEQDKAVDCRELTISDSLYQLLAEGSDSFYVADHINRDSIYIQGDCIHIYVGMIAASFWVCQLVCKSVQSSAGPAEIDLIFYENRPDGWHVDFGVMGFIHYDISPLRSMTNVKELKINLVEYGNPEFVKELIYRL